MILLTKTNARERCRTCLRKLLKDEDNSHHSENVVVTFQSKFADISSNKEFLEIMEKHLSKHWKEEFCKDQLYPQFVCMDCLKQLQSFGNFRKKAIESAKKLYMVFNDSCSMLKIEINDDEKECSIDANQNLNEYVKDDMFNLLLKDSLMETEAIILNDVDNNNDLGPCPDPFQNTLKQQNVKKPRTRRAKSKIPHISNSKAVFRKSKKSSNFEENDEVKCNLKPIMHDQKRLEKMENEDINITCHSPECTLQMHDEDSSDDEVLSKKLVHSNKEINGKQKQRTDLKGKQSYSNQNHEIESSDSKGNTEEVLKEKIIKTEYDSDADMSSDEYFPPNADNLPKRSKIEKKKRHYILNSGRKKGLANRYKCEQCQHKFGHKLTLEAHVRKVHEGEKKAFKCQLCDKAYSFIGGLSTHIRDVHERKQDSYDCSVPGCDKKYSNFITLQRHVRFKHLNMETPHQYVCEQCGATFKQSSNLRYHMKTRHPTDEDLKRKELQPKDRLECEECKKSFHSQYTLKYHKLRVHADEKKFECKVCGRRVAKQFMLDSHMLVHSDQKMACKFCGREFVRKYQVEAHIRAVHQKLKPFQCPHCSESFASRKTLRHHIYIHTGEKPYVCDICGQAYRQPTCLKNHRKIHNKLSVNNATGSIVANRSFMSNFLQKGNALANGEENIIVK